MKRLLHRGFATVEVLVGLAVAPLVVGGALTLLPGATDPSGGEVTAAAGPLRLRAEAYLSSTGRCPSAADLARADGGDAPIDPWGEAYWFLCRDGHVTALSDGPDGEPFTADDLGDPEVAWAPPRRRPVLGVRP